MASPFVAARYGMVLYSSYAQMEFDFRVRDGALLERVARRVTLPPGVDAAVATAVVLGAATLRVRRDEAQALARALPEARARPVARWARERPAEVVPLGRAELVRRVASALSAPLDDAERLARAVLGALDLPPP